MPSQVRPSHAASVVQMRVRPFEVLAPSPQQGHAPCTADASAIRIDRITGHGVLRPVASAAIRFRDVAPQVEGRQIREHLITVVPLVRGAVARGVPGVPVEPVSCGVMAEVPPVWRPQAGGPSVHPRSGGRDREAECAGDLVHADRRIGRRSTAAGDGEGPLNGR